MNREEEKRKNEKEGKNKIGIIFNIEREKDIIGEREREIEGGDGERRERGG